ncbi:MAG TPA: ComEC/Rec2 family competence protein [Solirubrobacteraceae bacterium]|nr:ComEC/Rec2 family competence protein [Solirubrobacteraceae bacterium]
MTVAAPAAAAARWRALIADHPRHLALFALVAGLLCGGWAPGALPAVAALAALAAGRAGLALLAAAAVVAGAAAGTARREAVDRVTLPAPLGAALTAELVPLEPLRRRASGELVARARLAAGPARGEVLLLRLRPAAGVAAAAGVGAVVRASGRLAPLGRFDALQRRRGAAAALVAWRLEATGRVRGGPAGAVDAVRRRAERGLERGLPPPRAALLAGMVLGRDDGIEQQVREAFQASGLAHLLAVSGTNVMLLATLVLAAGALVGASLRARLVAALALVALYVPLTGAGPSIQRAGVMGAAGLVAALAGRPASRWYALGLAAAVTLALNPYAAGEPGWQLSFAAVAGLLALAPALRQALERRRVPRPLAEVAAMTIAATVATAPLMAAHFEYLSLASLPANVAAAPAVAPVMWLGTVAAAVAQATPALAAPLNALNAPLLGYVEGVAVVAAGVPGATVPVALSGAAGAAAGYAALAAFLLAGRALWRVRARRAPARERRAPGPAAIAAAAVLAGGAALAAAGSGPPPPPHPDEVVVSFLDVGQGDATLVQSGGAALLFDTGPPEGGVVRRVRQAGVKRLDVLVITHAQLDHEGAALAVLRELRPRLVVDGGAGWPTPVQRALPAAAAAAGARVVPAAAGDALRLGGLTVRMIWPPRALAAAPPEGDPNDRALVAHVRRGAFDLLLTADAESEVTGPLPVPAVDALKVAHHGSADAGLPAALARLRPRVAAIEVGRGNDYGHPAPSTLAGLRAAVPHVFRTDRDGTVRLRARGDALAVERLGPGR